MKEYILASDAAKALGVENTAVYQAIQKGKLDGGKFDGKWIVAKESAENYKPRKYRDRPGVKGGRPPKAD